MGGSGQSQGCDTSPSEHFLPGGFSAWLFQPCLLNCSPSGPSLHTAWTPSLCPAQTSGWVAGQRLPSQQHPWEKQGSSEQDHALAGSQCGHPLRGAEPHLSGTHTLPSYPSPSQNSSHKTWDHQVTSVAQQAQAVPERVLAAPGREQHLQPHVSCLVQLSSALGDATAGKWTRRDSVLACR